MLWDMLIQNVLSCHMNNRDHTFRIAEHQCSQWSRWKMLGGVHPFINKPFPHLVCSWAQLSCCAPMISDHPSGAWWVAPLFECLAILKFILRYALHADGCVHQCCSTYWRICFHLGIPVHPLQCASCLQMVSFFFWRLDDFYWYLRFLLHTFGFFCPAVIAHLLWSAQSNLVSDAQSYHIWCMKQQQKLLVEKELDTPWPNMQSSCVPNVPSNHTWNMTCLCHLQFTMKTS